MHLRHIRTIADTSPAQFEARTDDDRPAYVRVQEGWLTVEVGLPGDSMNALPGGGYIVFEEVIDLPSGDRDAITWDEVRGEIEPCDWRERLAALEETARAYRARWKEIFGGMRRSQLPGPELWTLSLSDVVWMTPSRDRVGRFDFEWAMRDYCQSGICAYAFTDPEADAGVITILHTPATAGRWNAMDLALAGVEAFGGPRFGPTGGAGRGEAEGIRTGDADEAFARVAQKLAEA